MTDVSLIRVLRGFVQDAEPVLDGAPDAAALWKQAAQQNLLPVLAYMNRRWAFLTGEAVVNRLNGVLYGTLAASAERCVRFEALSAVFTEESIPHLPVKGYYLRECYPVPELRTFGDIDVLIHPEDRARTDALMKRLGYAPQQNWEPTYAYQKGMEHYELHTNLMDADLDGRADLRAYFAQAWQHADAEAGLRFRPEAEFHFVYLVCHLAKHLYGGGAGLRMYLDLALFLRRYDRELDWEKIAAAFASLRLTSFFHTALNACRVWFGSETICPLPEPEEAALQALADYTLGADLFGHLRDHTAVQVRKQSSRGGALRRMLFPPAEEIEARYTFLQKRRWLLPLAWIVRVFANLRLLPQRLRELRRVARADERETRSYASFMESIGL